MSSMLNHPPVLSTPADQVVEAPAAGSILVSTLQDAELESMYEIERTKDEILAGGWKTIALQFPDHMLVDAPRVVQLLEAQLGSGAPAWRIHILADTSYSACCVDEVAAEHADCDVVVHYGRTCLSTTSRVPVVHVYTSHGLAVDVVDKFRAEFPDLDARVVVMADVTYQEHVDGVVEHLKDLGYTHVRGTVVEKNPDAVIPNRRIVPHVPETKEYALFHISDPPTALLLVLHTRFASLRVLSTSTGEHAVENPSLRAAGLLRRRYARVLSLAAAGVVGILVNTLSVSNYLASIEVLRAKISAASKKSYTVVVGKLNPAKLANFAEIEGWVVVGCWESGLVEDDGAYWRPVVTPYEMEVALLSEEERVWGVDWWAGLEKLKLEAATPTETGGGLKKSKQQVAAGTDEDEDEEESLPPQFDLRTGKLVGHSRPMNLAVRSSKTTTAIAARSAGEMASINGVLSPGAEFLRSSRTWQGLGTDFDAEASTLVEEGQGGIARGYRVGEGTRR